MSVCLEPKETDVNRMFCFDIKVSPIGRQVHGALKKSRQIRNHTFCQHTHTQTHTKERITPVADTLICLERESASDRERERERSERERDCAFFNEWEDGMTK